MSTVISRNVRAPGVHVQHPEGVGAARRAYLDALLRACPATDAAFSDLSIVFGVLLGQPEPAADGRLSRARGAYLASLQSALPDREARVRDLAHAFRILLARHPTRR